MCSTSSCKMCRGYASYNESYEMSNLVLMCRTSDSVWCMVLLKQNTHTACWKYEYHKKWINNFTICFEIRTIQRFFVFVGEICWIFHLIPTSGMTWLSFRISESYGRTQHRNTNHTHLIYSLQYIPSIPFCAVVVLPKWSACTRTLN